MFKNLFAAIRSLFKKQPERKVRPQYLKSACRFAAYYVADYPVIILVKNASEFEMILEELISINCNPVSYVCNKAELRDIVERPLDYLRKGNIYCMPYHLMLTGFQLKAHVALTCTVALTSEVKQQVEGRVRLPYRLLSGLVLTRG